MKKMVVFTLAVSLLLGPAVSFAAEAAGADLNIPEYTDNFTQLAANCLRWTQQCKDDPFDPGRVDCTQNCQQWDYSDGSQQNGGNEGSSGGGELGLIGSAAGLILVGLILYWALTSPG